MQHIESSGVLREQWPFVPTNREAEFCARHGVEMRRLKNGVTVVGMQHMVEDNLRACVTVDLATGAYNDLPDKRGMFHALEHLVVDDGLQQRAQEVDAFINAATGAVDYHFLIEGPSHPGVKDFGIWPFLGDFKGMLERFWLSGEALDLALEQEKQIITRELAERQAMTSFMSWWYRQYWVLAQDNPYNPRLEPGGTVEGLVNVTRRDVEDLFERVFTASGMVVSALAHGGERYHRELVEELSREFGDFPRRGEAQRIDYELLGKVNPLFGPDLTAVLESGNGQGVRTVELVWALPGEPYTSRDYGLWQLGPCLSRKVSDYVRKKGYSYGGWFNVETYGETRVCVVRSTLANTPDVVEHAQGLKEEMMGVIENMSKEELKRVNEAEELRQKAVPVPTEWKFRWLVHGMKRFGRILDIDRMIKARMEVTADDLAYWQEKLLETGPAVFVL